jgi:hypothetical protein
VLLDELRGRCLSGIGILRAVKKLIGFACAVLVTAAAAPVASAADIQTCRPRSATSDAPAYKRVGREVRKAIVPEAKKYLGRQYTAQWLQPADAGWYVGVAPGRRSLAQVRTWLAARVAKHFTGSEADLIRERMHVIRQPYGLTELQKVGNQVWDILRMDGPGNWTGDDACTLSDAYRTEITLYEDSTQADVEAVRKQLARFGDRVRVTRVDRPLDDHVD